MEISDREKECLLPGHEGPFGWQARARSHELILLVYEYYKLDEKLLYIDNPPNNYWLLNRRKKHIQLRWFELEKDDLI